MVVDADGKLIYISPSFEEDVAVIDTSDNISDINNIDQGNPVFDPAGILTTRNNDKYGQMLDAIKLSVRDYIDKIGIDNVTI